MAKEQQENSTKKRTEDFKVSVPIRYLEMFNTNVEVLKILDLPIDHIFSKGKIKVAECFVHIEFEKPDEILEKFNSKIIVLDGRECIIIEIDGKEYMLVPEYNLYSCSLACQFFDPQNMNCPKDDEGDLLCIEFPKKYNLFGNHSFIEKIYTETDNS